MEVFILLPLDVGKPSVQRLAEAARVGPAEGAGDTVGVAPGEV